MNRHKSVGIVLSIAALGLANGDLAPAQLVSTPSSQTATRRTSAGLPRAAWR